MNLPKYASAPLCMLLLALAASSFAADNASDKPAPAAVPAAEQADYAEKQAEAAKAEAEKAKKEAEAKAEAEKAKKEAEAKAAAEAEQIMKRRDKAKEEAAEKAQAALKAEVEAHKAKKEAEAKAEAKAAEEKAKATAEEKKKAAEDKVATAFEGRFPELAKAIADADLSAEKKAEVDVLSANLMASSDALNEVTAREAAGEAQPAEKLEAEIECLTNYTAILAAVPSPENETLLADKRLELQSAREDRLMLAQKEFEEGRIDSDQLRELEEKYVKADAVTEAEPVKAAKKEKKEPFWGYKKHKPLPCLVIVANYRIPRKVIAEYLRTKYDVPYVLLPSDPGKPSKDDQVYFSGGKKNSGELEVALPAPQLSQFIAYLRPETVIFLGDESYINPVYRLAVPEGIDKVEFNDSEWKVNTARLDEFFRRTLKTDVSDHYLDYLQDQGKRNAE